MKPEPRRPKTLVIGVGNRDRGDDAVGPLVIDTVRDRCPGQVETLVMEGDLSDLALRWGPDQAVMLVDAVHGGLRPGTIVTFDGLSTGPPDNRRPISSHGVGVAEAIKLARLLHRLPHSLIIFGVEATSFDHFAPLTEPVAAAVPRLAERILERVRRA